MYRKNLTNRILSAFMAGLIISSLAGCASSVDQPTTSTVETRTYPSVTETATELPTEPLTEESTTEEPTTEEPTTEEPTTEIPTTAEQTTATETTAKESSAKETTTAFDKEAINASIEAIYPTDYVTTESVYKGKTGMLASDYTSRLVRPIAEEDLIRIDEIIDEITTKKMTRTEKIRAVHDWMVTNINYDWKFAAQTVHVALEKGLGVCNSYADVFVVFMTEMGIPVNFAIGYSRNVYHIWNIVQLEDGYWYYIDVTWDDKTSKWASRNDTSNEILYTYFLKKREEFDKDHINQATYTPTPLATLPQETKVE